MEPLQPEPKKGVKELRKDLSEIKGRMFHNTAVLRADQLRAYLDNLRYAENAINALSARGEKSKEQKHPQEYKKQRSPSVSSKSSSEYSSSDSEEEKPKKHKEKHPQHKEPKLEKPVEKIKKDVEKVKQEMKGEIKEHKKEIKTLDDIPKQLKKMVKDQMKADGHQDVGKAYRKVKKAL